MDQLSVSVLYLGRRGGIAHYTLELVRALYKRCKVSCHLSAHCVIREQIEDLGCRVSFHITYNNLPTFLARTIQMREPRRIASAIRSDRSHLILDTGAGPWGDLLQRMTPELRWVKVVHDAVPHNDRWKRLSRIQRIMFPLKSHALVGASRYTAATLRVQHPSLPIIASRHGVICNRLCSGVDIAVQNRKKFLFFGRLEPYKGISTLLEAFELARRVEPDIQLTICGEGYLSKQQKTHISAMGVQLQNRWIPEREMEAIFAKSGVIVLPYLAATQSGVAAVAMANGLPAIASSVGALPEQILDGISGYIVPPGDAFALSDAMTKIASSDEVARNLANGSLRQGQVAYAWESIADDLIRDLSELLASPADRRPSSSDLAG
jgi:glycosyltransferase involved in cell wall biosynthesis